MSLSTELTRLFGITHPIVLAPMDLVSDARLTAAVSAAGGLGLLGGGYGDASWLARELATLVPLAAGRPFGVGFITWRLARQPQLLVTALAARPAAVMLSFGDPAPFVAPIHDAGAKLICQVQTVAMTRQALDAGADLIVAQGSEAGGHGVSRGLVSLLPEVVDAVAGRVPVIAAGGLADGRGLAAALMFGAAGVLLGTRLYASAEAAAPDAAKQRIVDASGDDSVRSVVFDITRRTVWPAPFTGRCLRNQHLERWLGREVELLRAQDSEGERYVAAREAADFDVAAVIAGEAAGLVRDVPPAARIIERLVADAQQRLRGAVQHLEAR